MNTKLPKNRTYKSKRPNPLRNFNFIVKFIFNTNDIKNNPKRKSIIELGFNKITGLKISNPVFEIKHTPLSGGVITSKFPTGMEFSPIIFEKGSIPYIDNNNDEFIIFQKFNELYNKNKTYPKFNNKFFKFDIEISLFDKFGWKKTLDSPRQPQKIWSISKAWVSDIEWGDLDAQSNAVLIERFIIQYEWMTFDYGLNTQETRIEQDTSELGNFNIGIPPR